MTRYADMATKAADQAFGVVKQAGETATKAVSQVSEMVGGVIPELKIPRVGRIAFPEPKYFVESGFEIAERVLDAQKSAALSILDAVEPITSKFAPNGTAKKVVRKTKSTTAKATA